MLLASSLGEEGESNAGKVCLAVGSEHGEAEEVCRGMLQCLNTPQQHPRCSSGSPGAWSPPRSGSEVRLVQNPAESKRQPGEERILGIQVIWDVALLLYPCWSKDRVAGSISGEENHGNRNLVPTLIYCHRDICQVPAPWEKCIFHQYCTEISIRRINALNNCQRTLRIVHET